MHLMKCPLLTCLSALILIALPTQAGVVDKTIACPAPLFDPLDSSELLLESGALWRVGHNGTPLDYVILPQMLTYKSAAIARIDLAGGTLAIRNRFSLLAEPIVEGPESYYFGASASGILEWWDAPWKFSVFFSGGGGVGWMDSKGYEVEGAQGQDFNLNWFLYSGARYRITEQATLGLGVMYQHISNGGMDNVNPGIDALGPMLSFGWSF